MTDNLKSEFHCTFNNMNYITVGQNFYCSFVSPSIYYSTICTLENTDSSKLMTQLLMIQCCQI